MIKYVKGASSLKRSAFFTLQSPSHTSAGTRSGPCCAPSSRRRGLRIDSLPRRRESSITPSLLLSHVEPLRWVRHGFPSSPSQAHMCDEGAIHSRLSSNSVPGFPSKPVLMGEGRAAGLVFELMIALPDHPAVLVVAVPDLRAVPPKTVCFSFVY